MPADSLLDYLFPAPRPTWCVQYFNHASHHSRTHTRTHTHNDMNSCVEYIANTSMLEVSSRVRYVANTSHRISQWGELTRDVCSSHKPPDCTGEISFTRCTMFWHLFTLVAQCLKVSFSTLAELKSTLMSPACLSVLIDTHGCHSFIHSAISDDRSKASSKTIPPQSAI